MWGPGSGCEDCPDPQCCASAQWCGLRVQAAKEAGIMDVKDPYCDSPHRCMTCGIGLPADTGYCSGWLSCIKRWLLG